MSQNWTTVRLHKLKPSNLESQNDPFFIDTSTELGGLCYWGVRCGVDEKITMKAF